MDRTGSEIANGCDRYDGCHLMGFQRGRDSSLSAGHDGGRWDRVLCGQSGSQLARLSIGTPNNTVRIVIIDLTHKIKEFNEVATGDSDHPVQSENDKWWLNP